MLKNIKRMSIIALMCLIYPINSSGANVVEIGAGWENMGLSDQTTWKPYGDDGTNYGSRKEASVVASWRYLGNARFYYAPFARMQYGYDWSLSGSMNLLEINLGLLGLGVYMSSPMSAYSSAERKGKWFATIDINLGSISFGGNLTPYSGGTGVREWTDPGRKFGNQYYTSGLVYSYFQYSIPVHLQFWNMITEDTGIGFFIESNVSVIEKSLNLASPVSIGYNVLAGFSLMFF